MGSTSITKTTRPSASNFSDSISLISSISSTKSNTSVGSIDIPPKKTKRLIVPFVERDKTRSFNSSLIAKDRISFSTPIKFDHDEKIPDDILLPLPVLVSAEILKEATNSCGVVIYMVDSESGEIFINEQKLNVHPERFRWQITCPAVKHIICAPITTPDNEVIAIFEFHKHENKGDYEKSDVQLAVSMTSWVGSGIYQNQLRLGLRRQQNLNNTLLHYINDYFSEPKMILNDVLSQIMNYAKKILKGEKAFVYVLSTKVPNAFDYYFQSKEDADVFIRRTTPLKFDKLPGILKHTIKYKQPLIINNIFDEPQFKDLERMEKGNNELCRSLLCAPTTDNNTVTGVILLTNKIHNTYFTTMDDGTFQIFATYCSLALHHYRVKKELQKTILHLTLDEEVMQHHLKPCIHDYERVKNSKLIAPTDFFSFTWYPFDEHYAKMDEYTLVLYHKILGSYFMRRNNIPKYVTTIKKSYRTSTLYHNFEHGYTVCHSAANILIRNKDCFTGVELVGFMIGSIGHDVDHRGQTNSFIYLVKHPMALLYDSAILENHHFYVTNKIIKECHLFSYLKPELYKEVINEVEVIILHTDLVLHFRGRAKLAGIIAERQFKWANPDHRFLMKGIIMTSCDLTGQSKTFRVADRLLNLLYLEFYAQGDEERKLGITPLAMMDRDKIAQTPDDQVKFLSFVVIPCNELLYNLFPNTQEMIDNTR
ncbi:cAMP and cAMP-inhibited cGMP 3',5'-cyclic phosphodiesterase 10A-like [Lycorma delicatula]|uniref:cAMP and cAMP-inhibited cGMP 3',5'-cyclic phosphodiesterase 10A-like n=1 Tax=Lycorma delicatula TaxID=130591 RepID=UPI003F516B23